MVVGIWLRSRSTLAANSSSDSSDRITLRFALRRARSRPRRASRPTQRSSRGHSAPMRTATARPSSAIQTTLTGGDSTGATLPRVRRALLFTLCVAVLAVPGVARAGEQTLVLHSFSPIAVGPYGVVQGTQLIPGPALDGYVTGISATVVDLNGVEEPDTHIMLHHIVFE